MLLKVYAQIRNFEYHIGCNFYFKFKQRINDNKNFKYCFTFKPKFNTALNVVGVHVTCLCLAVVWQCTFAVCECFLGSISIWKVHMTLFGWWGNKSPCSTPPQTCHVMTT